MVTGLVWYSLARCTLLLPLQYLQMISSSVWMVSLRWGRSLAPIGVVCRRCWMWQVVQGLGMGFTIKELDGVMVRWC